MDYKTIKNQLIQLLLNNTSFACWRLPGKEPILITGKWQQVNALTECINKNGFYVQSFDSSKKYFLNNETNKENYTIFKHAEEQAENKEHYLYTCDDYIQKIKSGYFNKLVLSRISQINNINAEDIVNIFLKANTIYNNAFNYILNIPGYAIWAGASPEILVKTENNILTTVALAGTKKSETGKTTIWQQKEIEEQELVSDFILEILNRSQLNSIIQDNKQTVQAGNLLHIKTVFKATFKSTTQLVDTIEKLHPTPAVCGIPKQKALNYITRTENYNREFYTGFLGPICDNQVNFYVNLRCLKYRDNKVLFYAGSGITAISNPLDEWEETENKINTLRTLLNHKNN